MKPIKVAMLGPYTSSLEFGGVAVHINKLTEYLSNRDDIILHIITLGEKDQVHEKENLNIHKLRRTESPLDPFSITQINALKRKIIEISPDIVHAQGTFVPYSTAAALIRNRFPTLLTVHGVAAMDTAYYNGIKKVLSELIQIPHERYVVSAIPNLIVVAPQIREIISGMTNSRIHMIPNGMDLRNFENISPQSIGWPSIFYVGRLHKEKGVDILLDAIPLIRESYPSIKAYIAGSGPEEARLKQKAKENNIDECVRFLDYISEEEKYSMLKSADVFLLPSRFDYGPIVLPEAMACGIPVIASNIGGIPFLIEDEHTGLLFKSENKSDLAGKVIQMLDNNELRIKIIKAAKNKINDFSWASIAEKTVSVYSNIINNS